jgi:GntR family transcriptional regulator/MocR family aminotransferase
MEPIFGFDLELPERGSRMVLRDLHAKLRAAVLDGRLPPGARLPPSRNLADALRVSRNTAVAAYDLLLSEGFLEARRGAGTFVSRPLTRLETRSDPAQALRLAPLWRELPNFSHDPLEAGPSPRYDLRPGLPDKLQFPHEVWRRLSVRALHALSKTRAAYAEPEGRPALRTAIAHHVAFSRGVACDSESVVVTNGAQQAFDLIARILVTPNRTKVIVEDPGYPPLHFAFAAAGAQVGGIQVDHEGLVVEALPDDARIVCVTPSHQFPLGPTMSLRRRMALIRWAHQQNAVIIEDDYDGEFRYEGRPIDALQMLDRGRDAVFYIGSFSKSMFPTLRIGFVVAPAWARPALVEARRIADGHTPVHLQDTLASFIKDGHLARHVRKMRRIYSERRSRILEAIETHCEGLVVPIRSDPVGLHLAVRTPESKPADIVSRAFRAGLSLRPISRYEIAGRGDIGLVLGFGMIHVDEIGTAIQTLRRNALA